MSKVGISVRIDVSKIDKARLYKGAKGTYLDMTTFVDLDNKDQYDNNGFISQSVSKEEREQGVNGNILGNVRVFYTQNGDGNTQSGYTPQPAAANAGPDYGGGQDFSDDIPFAPFMRGTLI